MSTSETEYPNTPGDGHQHIWHDLKELDGKDRTYLASYCTLCGDRMID